MVLDGTHGRAGPFRKEKNLLFPTYASVSAFVQRQNAWGFPDVFTESTESESMFTGGGGGGGDSTVFRMMLQQTALVWFL